MQSTSQVSSKPPAFARAFPSLDVETRSHVDTACAAFHLMRKENTLRIWASKQSGPLAPTRICGRLSWAVADIKRVLNSAA